MSTVLEQQLIAARETAKALVASIDAALGVIRRPAVSAADILSGGSGTCVHPPEKRIATPAMGKPDAYLCTGCGAEV